MGQSNNNITAFGNRLDSLRLVGEKKKEFSKRLGIDPSLYSKYLRGRTPESDVLQRIAERTGVNINWLLTGGGSPYPELEEVTRPLKDQIMGSRPEPAVKRAYGEMPENSRGRRRARDPREYLKGIKRFDNVSLHPLGHAQAVPVVGLTSAGLPMRTEDGEFPPGVADEYAYTDRKGKNLIGVRVAGDSMEPVFHEGDLIIINPNLEAHSGDFILARIGDEGTVKQLFIKSRRDGDGIWSDHYTLHPLNPSYKDIEVTGNEEFEIIGKVVERKTYF